MDLATPASPAVIAGSPQAAGGKTPWPLVAALTAIYTYAFVDRVILALLVEPIKAELHVGDVQMSLLLGLAFAGFYAALNLPAGYLVDRFNRRALIGMASILWAMMTVCCALARDFNQMFLARAGVGLAEAVIAPAAFSLIRDAVPERARGSAFSVYAMAPMFGGALALAGGGVVLHAAKAGAFHHVAVLAGFSPWRIVLVLVGLCGLPLSLSLLAFKEPQRSAIGSRTEAGAGPSPLLHVRRRLGLYVALVAFVSFGAMMSFGQSAWLPAMLGRKWALPPDRIGPVLGGLTVCCGFLGLSFSGYVMSRMVARGRDIRVFGAFAVLGSAIGLAGAAVAPTWPATLVCAGLGLFFVGISFPIGATTLSQVTPPQVMGKITGVYLLFQTLVGQALGPMLIAVGSEKVFHGRAGLPDAFALMMGLFGLGAAAAALALRRALRRTVRSRPQAAAELSAAAAEV